MANTSKIKGDRAERAAVEYLVAACPDLCLPKAQRMLGAGRAEDIGDLYVFPDVAVQVRSYAMSQIGTAVRSSAKDAALQAANGDMPFALGLVPFPRARTGTVRWLACVQQWPANLPVEPVAFSMVSRALTWVRDDDGPHGYLPHPRATRIARLAGGDTSAVLIAPIEAWLDAYRSVAETRLAESA